MDEQTEDVVSLSVVIPVERILTIVANRREPIAVRPIFRLRGINVTGLNEIFVLPDRFGEG